MKHVTKQLFSVVLLLSTFGVRADDSSNVTGLSYFMGQRNSAITSNGLVAQANRCCKESDTLTAHVSAGVEYSRSMKNDELAEYFSVNGTKTFTFGSDTGGAALGGDIAAVNFFMPNNHQSTVTLNPKFWSVNTDLRLHVGLDEFVEGLWMSANLPIVHAEWDLGLTSIVKTAGTALEGAAGTFGAAAITFPYLDPVLAFKGDKSATGTVAVAPLSYGRIDGVRKATKVGDVRLVLGYDLINKDNAQLGLGVMGLVNGAEVSDAKYVNTPQIGTAGRHGIGGRLDGSVRLWENNDWSVAAHLRADGAYIFDTTVRRSFDFTANGDWSRYSLLSKHTAFNIISTVSNAINTTSLQAKIGNYGMYDVNVMFSLTRNTWEMNVGYNLAGMSAEKFESFVDTIAPSTYTFYSYTSAPVVVAAAADNGSRLHAPAIKINGSDSRTTPGVAAAVAGPMLDAAALTAAAVTNASLNTASALQPSFMTHRVYGNIGYCYDANEWMPHVSIGGSAELSANNKAVRQWGVHATGGICF